MQDPITLRSPETAAAWSGRAARPDVRQAAIGLGLFAAILGAWIAIHLYGVFVFRVTPVSLVVALPVAALQCWLTVGLFIVAHDAMHGSLVPGRPRVNAAIGAFILMIYAGFGWRRVLAAHMAHHRAPGTADDPDFFTGAPDCFWPWYATFFRRYFGLSSVLFVSSVVALYILGFGARVENVVLFYGLPSIASSVQLFYFGTFRPHRHEEGADFADRHRARSSEFGYLASLASCFHFGYHHEHHARPGVPWWGLPAERRKGGPS